MGFDALLKKKSFKTYKFKATVSLAISRLAVLKNQRQVRYSIARSDVIQLLNIGHHERALLRVEVVIKEQNMLDAFVMMEGYCDLLIERLHQIEQEKTCPEELKEAASSLIYASSRCGEFPELQEIRAMLASHFGKDFVARAVELRNNCGVNVKMIQKLSTRMPTLENRIKVLKDIASENNIVLLLDDVILETSVDKVKEAQPNSYTTKKYEDSKTEIFLQAATELEAVEGVTDKKRYKNVADAAQAAFESAAYAAAAARAAVELSRADSHDPSDNHHSPISPNLHSKENSSLQEPENSISNIEEEEKIHPVENDVSESDKEEEATKTVVEEFKQERNNESKAFMRSISTLSSEESDNEDLVKKLVEKEINFDGSEDEKTYIENTMSPRTQDLGLESKQTVPGNYGPDNENVCNKESDSISIEARPYSPAHKFFLFGSRARSKTVDKSSDNSGHCLTGMFRVPKDDLLGKDKVPISVRTRRTFRWGQ